MRTRAFSGPWSLRPSAGRYKEHEDGFLRLQLIRYESVELTEQLIREKQSQCQGVPEPPLEAHAELRGVLLEEPTEDEAEDQSMDYTLSLPQTTDVSLDCGAQLTMKEPGPCAGT